MKIPYVIALVVVSVLITVAIEESRIASLTSTAIAFKGEADSQGGQPTHASQAGNPEAIPVIRKKPRPEAQPVSPASDEESIAKTVRKMWDNPAGKSMMNQGVKIAVAMMYEDFMDDLDLTREESDYFKTLLGKEMSDQQELGMKMMSASKEEREEFMAEIKKRKKENNEEIEKFLNNEEDYEAYKQYKDRLPERQQLDGIRATMTSKGLSIDTETETRLIDAMYTVRTESKGPDFSGPDAMEELSKGNITERYEQSWQRQQEALRLKTETFLDAEQVAAFQEFQVQMKDMQLMGLKMAEKMFSNDENESK